MPKNNSKTTTELRYETNNGCTLFYKIVPPSPYSATPFVKITGIGKLSSEYLKDKTLTIPENIKGYEVRSIEESAFCNADIGNVIIPDSVLYINDYAFKNSDVKSVHIGSGVRKLGVAVFEGCSDLKSVKLQEGLLKIFDNAFSECRSLTSIVIPDSVTELGDSVFDFCESLKSIHIGAGLKNIGEIKTTDFAFGCESLKKITVSPLNKRFKVEKDILYNIDEEMLIKVFNNSEIKKDVIIPNWVECLSHCSFHNVRIKNLVIKSPKLYGIGRSQIANVETVRCIPDSYTDEAFREMGIKTVPVPENKIGNFINSLSDTENISK